MNKHIEKAEELIKTDNYKEALKIAKKRHGRDDIESYLAILDILINKEYLPAIEEKGMYYQYFEESHDNGDYGEKYFDAYLKIQPQSVNVLCDKALSQFNKNQVNNAIDYMDRAYKKYDEYKNIEKPRISKKEVKMGKIELLIEAKEYAKALGVLNSYEEKYGGDEKTDLYKGLMLQKKGENKQAIDYLNRSLKQEQTLIAINARGDAYYEMGDYRNALDNYNRCISHENEIKDDLELLTNFNYKAAYCEIKMGNDNEAVKYLNKTINMLNKYGRLQKDIEAIYQKCSFEKENLIKKGNVKDSEFKKTRFLSSKTAIILLIIILILYVLLTILGY